ncbi:MAG TPA: MlaE family lipid ABC transporter permease subunit [Rhizomicrobium sp.]|nr:MlaE family lipid ABC transporter permease subunit [Rhizomicrobium sp.]
MRNIAPPLSAEVPATLRTERRGNVVRIIAGGDWVTSETARLDHETQNIATSGAGEAEIDGSAITSLDSAGMWLLLRMKYALESNRVRVPRFALPERFAPLLSAVEREGRIEPLVRKRPPQSLQHFLERIGKGTMHALRQGYDMVGFLGRVTVETTEAILEPRRELPFPALVHQIEETGLTALPIVGLLAFLIGVVIAYQGADQLKKIAAGAEIYTINLLGVSILRELGVLITAIIVAGRSGSAFTAQIGTMRVNEEIDAMQTLGLNTTELLVVTRVLGLVIALPFLTLFADIVGVVGGMLMCDLDLGITIPVFIREFKDAVTLNTFLVGMIKAPVFAFIIGIVGCFEGLRVERNAASVGLLTTRAVVEAIFLVIVFDAGFSILFSKLGI